MSQRSRKSASSSSNSGDDGKQDNNDSVMAVTITGQMPPTPASLQALEMGLAMTYMQTNCPPGLEHLLELNRVLLNEGVGCCSGQCHFDRCCGTRPFTLLDSLGQQHYTAAENSNICGRLSCGKDRSYCVRVKDNHDNTVMCAKRPLKLCTTYNYTCSNCCVQEICVEAPEGNTIGYVRYEKSLTYTGYVATDSGRNHVIRIGGYNTCQCCPNIDCSCDCKCPSCADCCKCPSCADCCKCPSCADCCRDPDSVFTLVTVNGGDHIGDLTRYGPACCTYINNYGLDFPVDLDVKMKATLIGAVFLFNLMWFAK